MTKNRSNKFKRFCVMAVITALSLLIICLSGCGENEDPPVETTTPPVSPSNIPVIIASNTDLTPSVIYAASGTDLKVALPIDLGDGLIVDEIGFYTGSASGEDDLVMVYDSLALKLTNNTGKNIAEAKITFGDYSFELLLLPDGGSVMLAESTHSSYNDELPAGNPTIEDIKYLEAETIALDSFEFTINDNGKLVVKNISDSDISESLVLYYQYESIGGLLGDACYSVSLDGGIAAGEEKTIVAANAIAESTRVILAVIG